MKEKRGGCKHRSQRCHHTSGILEKVGRRMEVAAGRDKDNSQHEPTTQIDASNLLRAIREAGRDRRYRRYESKSERNEGIAEQHLSIKPERALNGGGGIKGRGKEN